MHITRKLSPPTTPPTTGGTGVAAGSLLDTELAVTVEDGPDGDDDL